MGLVKKLKIQNKIKEWRLKTVVDETNSSKKIDKLQKQIGISEYLLQKKHIPDSEWEKIEELINDAFFLYFFQRKITCITMIMT